MAWKSHKQNIPIIVLFVNSKDQLDMRIKQFVFLITNIFKEKLRTVWNLAFLWLEIEDNPLVVKNGIH